MTQLLDIDGHFHYCQSVGFDFGQSMIEFPENNNERSIQLMTSNGERNGRQRQTKENDFVDFP